MQREYGTYEERLEKVKEVHGALEAYVARLVSRLDNRLVILFGSYADGSFDLGSDVDILLVAGRLPADPIKRAWVLRERGFPARLQVFDFTPEQFIKMVSDDHALAREALVTGRVLFIDEKYRERLLAAL